MQEQGFAKDERVWISQRADPFVYKHKDGAYYFTATVPEYDRIILRRAESLEGLKEAEEKVIWRKHEKGPMGNHIWAPELHYLDGEWYLYFAAGDAEDKWRLRPYVLRFKGEDPLMGPWEEMGMMQSAPEDAFSFRSFSLDGTVFENQGKRYYVWVEKIGVGKMISNLYIAQMENPVRLKTAQALLSTPDYPWERRGFWVNEGPAVLHHAGKIYLTYSASDTGVNYCMGMLSVDESQDVLDPANWRKRRYPVLASDEKKGIYGPGHNSFTEDEGGRPILVFHARTKKEIQGDPLYNPNRHAMMMPFGWNERGEPVFAF